jgi:pimeloyl-ACP methyl ester carboxylesterase
LLPHIGLDFAAHELADVSFASPEEAIEARLATSRWTPRDAIEEEVGEHLQVAADGRLRYRCCRPTVVSVYGELCTAPPPPETLRSPTLLVHAPAFGLVREEQLAAYGGRAELLAVPGGHIVYWDAFGETAAAIERFLEDPSA